MLKDIDNITNWIKEKVDEAKVDGVVIGLSGGIDSTATASLAVKALGKDKVLGVIMPCESNPNDMIDAIDVAKILDIEVVNVDLTKPFWDLIYPINQKIGFIKSSLTSANIKARLRMTTLYAFANEKNYMVIGTTNKSEMLLGYFTKYGDGGVDIEPIADYYKTEIKQIGYELGLPSYLIERVPSAGLWHGQTDENELGFSYEEFDNYYQKKDNSLTQEQKDKIDKMIIRTEHKRNVPPSFQRLV